MDADRDPPSPGPDPGDGPAFEGGPSELWKRLRGLDTFDRLRWLTEGDPLRLVAKVRAHLYERAWLLDVQQVTIRAASRIADAVDESVPDSIDSLVTDALVAVIRPLIEEEAELARGHEPVTEPYEVRFQVLRSMLEISPAQFRAACVAFHNLPELQRRATYAFLSGEGFTLHAEREGISAAEARDRMLHGLMWIDEQLEGEEDGDD